ncbi:outer membrane receptor protein involved in Fe transport [Flavobacterium sp. 7E]|uniref:outer membrane beta-barrel family protein n=1 Tax=Flavobacterium sp. 7E TaxID=2735898 RepID=UPI0015710F45|nr:outer membrane beta-barrel family protein [Flavobacterium sp. 7E]NRS88523.1 outer membrane receptor protein involved in Fe transport [Flavobacterium sp. 7E]
MKIKFFYTLLFITIITSYSFAQSKSVTLSGIVKDKADHTVLPYVNVVLKTEKDNAFVSGTVTDEEGRFSLSKIKSGNYFIEVSYIGYTTKKEIVFVGNLSDYLDLKTIEIATASTTLNEVVITTKTNEISEKMDKKTFSIKDNISQSGGSILQAIQNLPSVTTQDGKVQLRGNDKVTVLIDGKQTALTGFGNATGLDNIPASAIERIEIINNPSAKYDANGNAGIINIIYKKNKKNGFNGKIGLTTGLGSLWVRKENLPTITPQYTFTPKINPSISLNYRKDKVNVFFQGDYLYTETLNKNEFVTRNYANGDIINSQLKRNRNTHFTTLKSGIDYAINDQNSLTVSGMFGSEKIIDRGDQPFFNSDYSQRLRLWQFLEDELKTTVMATASYQHKFKEPGRLINAGFNYTFHREDEKYFYDNYLPSTTSTDAFKLISDEQVYDFNLDYIAPFKYGKLETGIKLRNRNIPTNMQFIPGENSVLDSNAGGWATYKELIPAVYGNYVFENKKWEAELGLRIEYVKIQYDVNPDHVVYKSDGYNYTQPFPNLRLAYKINNNDKISVFYNRRVDRPNEVDIRIFPKYDDAEIIKVGNPALRPQFTNSVELGYKTTWEKGSLYNAVYHHFAAGTITRISSTVAPSKLIYATFQNVDKSYNTGLETILSQEFSKLYSLNINLNAYRNQIDAFTVENKYPTAHTFSAEQQEIISGNLKVNNSFRFANNLDAQLTAIYLAPDIIAQGKIKARFSLDLGLKKTIQKGKGELFLNATDLLNTMIIKKEINGQGFNYISNDFYETQVIRLGYSYKF